MKFRIDTTVRIWNSEAGNNPQNALVEVEVHGIRWVVPLLNILTLDGSVWMPPVFKESAFSFQRRSVLYELFMVNGEVFLKEVNELD